MATEVERIEALREGLLAVGAEVLLPARHLAVFMHFAVTTEPTFHRSNSVVGHPLTLPNPQYSDAPPNFYLPMLNVRAVLKLSKLR